MFKVSHWTFSDLQVLSTLNHEYVQSIVDEASKCRHRIDPNEVNGDYIEITKEMKQILDSSDWISSRLSSLISSFRKQRNCSTFFEAENQELI